MGSRRTERLNEQLKREITRLALREVRDPRVTHPTITEVQVSQDLWTARVYVRPGPEGGDAADVVAGLAHAAPFLRKRLGEELRLRRVPELRFQADAAMERAQRIEELLSEVLPDDEDAPEAGTDLHEDDGVEPEADGLEEGEESGERS